MVNLPRLLVVGPVFVEFFVPDGVVPRKGEETMVERIPVGLGGALNVASVASVLGLDVTLLYPAGNGILDRAVAGGIDELGIKSLTWPSRDDPFVTIVHRIEDDRAFVSHADTEAWATCPMFGPADWIHVGGITEAFAMGDQIRSARSRGTPVSTCGCWSPEALTRLAHKSEITWDLLVLNRKEAEFAYLCSVELGLTIQPDIEEMIEYFSRVAVNVVITDGPSGAFGLLDGQHVEVRPQQIVPVDSTGAGDAFVAGLVAGRLTGLSNRAAIEIAQRAAGAVLGIHGGVLRDGSGLLE